MWNDCDSCCSDYAIKVTAKDENVIIKVSNFTYTEFIINANDQQ